MGDFIDGLGPAQIVGRQVLASPSMGEIQLALFDRKGMLEVEVVRAKGLLPKPGSKILPGNVSAFRKFGNPSEGEITKALICTRKQNPEGFWS